MISQQVTQQVVELLAMLCPLFIGGTVWGWMEQRDALKGWGETLDECHRWREVCDQLRELLTVCERLHEEDIPRLGSK